jgi:hypothetical protein
VWQLSLGHKTCRHNPKGFRGVGTAETRLDREVSSARTAHHETAQLVPKQANSALFSLHRHPGPSPRALSTHPSITHSPYRYYHKNTLYTTQTPQTPVTPCPAKREHRPATVRLPRPHQHPIHRTVSAVPQTAAPLHRIARRTTQRVRLVYLGPALPFPSRAAFAFARASPTAAHRDMYRRTPTTQTTFLG